MNLSQVTTNRNLWLTACFGSYMALLFIFALIYHGVFRSNPQNFSFNADILRSQVSSFKSSTEQEVVNLRVELAAYKRFANELTQRSEPPDIENGEVTFNLPDYKFTFFIPLTGTPEEQQQKQALAVVIHDRNGNEIKREVVALFGGPFFPNRISLYRDIANGTISTLEASIAENERRLATLGSLTPEVWSFGDFLYFSVITQTTVGYGDILPNSTLVRIIVMLQIVIGLAIVTFAINVIFTAQRA